MPDSPCLPCLRDRGLESLAYQVHRPYISGVALCSIQVSGIELEIVYLRSVVLLSPWRDPPSVDEFYSVFIPIAHATSGSRVRRLGYIASNLMPHHHGSPLKFAPTL